MTKRTKAQQERMERLAYMARKYRQAGNELAASRCEAQIRTIEAAQDDADDE